MSWSDEAVADSGPKKPVRNSVWEALPQIAQARVDGASWNAIFRKLTKEGKNVGAGPSSFNTARRALQKELDALIAEIQAGKPDQTITVNLASPASLTGEMVEAHPHTRAGFPDDRKPLAFGPH